MTKTFSDIAQALRIFWTLILLVVIALLTYFNTFDAPFVFDDLLNITQNPDIRISRITPEAFVPLLNSSRSVAGLSFALNYYLHGYDVTGYHVFNLAIHILTALLVWLIARQTLYLCHSKNALLPFFAAALWLVSPAHTQSVTYTVQRMNAMATMFYLLAMYCFIRGRIKTAFGKNRREGLFFFALCPAAALLGLATKETTATLPAMLLLYEWFFFQRLKPDRLKKQLPWAGLAALTMITLAIVFMGDNPFHTLSSMYEKHDFTPGQRILTEAGVVVYYISLLIFPFPSRLSLVYDFPLSRSVTEPFTTALAITALVTLCVAALYNARRHALPAYCILWFLITLSVESSIIGLDLIYEHRTYLPSIFPFIGFVWLVFSRAPSKSAAVFFLSVIIGICGIWTYQRNLVWQTPATLWRDTARKAPDNAIPFNNLAIELSESGHIKDAIFYYQKAIDINPDDAWAHYNLGVDLHQVGRINSAISHIETATTLEPEKAEMLIALGQAYTSAGRVEDAVNSYIKALSIKPDFLPALTGLGITLAASRRVDESLNTSPVSDLSSWQLARVYNSAATDLLKAGDPALAGRYYRKAVQKDPMYIDGLYNLGLVLAREKAFQQAAAVYARILAISPHEETARKRHAYCLGMTAGGRNE